MESAGTERLPDKSVEHRGTQRYINLNKLGVVSQQHLGPAAAGVATGALSVAGFREATAEAVLDAEFLPRAVVPGSTRLLKLDEIYNMRPAGPPPAEEADAVFTVRIPGHPALDFPWWGCLLLALAGLGFVAYVGMVMNTFFPRMCACQPRKKKLYGKGPATDVLYLTMSGLKPCH